MLWGLAAWKPGVYIEPREAAGAAIVRVNPWAGVVELVDTPDLGSGGFGRGGSSPSARTNQRVDKTTSLDRLTRDRAAPLERYRNGGLTV